MKRSEINQYIREAKAFMTKYHFMLPPWHGWTGPRTTGKAKDRNVMTSGKEPWAGT